MGHLFDLHGAHGVVRDALSAGHLSLRQLQVLIVSIGGLPTSMVWMEPSLRIFLMASSSSSVSNSEARVLLGAVS